MEAGPRNFSKIPGQESAARRGRSLRGRLLLRMSIAILIVEALLLAASLEVRRRELVRIHAPPVMAGRQTLPQAIRDNIRQDLRQYAWRIAVATGAVVLGSVALLYFLLNPLVIRPVRRLVDANQQLADIPESDMPDDDLGDIMRSRAGMLASLRHAQEELATANQHLEERVRQRTTELQEALDRLDRSRAQLIQAEKLSTMGVMSASFAHEMVQPFSSVGLLLLELKPNLNDPKLRETVENISRQLDAIIQTADNYRQFSRKARTPHTVSLNDAVRRAAAMLARPLEYDDVRVEFQLQEALPDVWADEILIQQITLNLLGNARHALTGAPRANHRIVIETTGGPEAVTLRVRDFGPGVDPGIGDRVFDLFFTTKDAEHGTGLGLAIVKDIARRIGAEVACENPPDGGACFSVRFATAATAAKTGME